MYSKYIVSVCLIVFAGALAASALADRQEVALRQNVSDEMHMITKSLEDLLSELGNLKKEATGRLSSVKNRASVSDQERIRQTKVSRFVLKRVAELELESLSMREELNKIFELQTSSNKADQKSSSSSSSYMAAGDLKQEDQDFEEPQSVNQEGSTKPSNGMPAATTTTSKPDEEATKIGFDLEALKKLGAELESEIEARQQQTPESLRGVHEQAIKLVDNMVQTYLGNVRRAIQRMTNFLDHQSSRLIGSRPRESPSSEQRVSTDFNNIRQSILDGIQVMSKQMHDFTMQWSRIVGKQQSPLLDRIPPRGVELWRDFWDTVRKQVRRINQEIRQLSQDMSRLITSRLPAGSGEASLLYAANSVQPVPNRFQEFYDKMSVSIGEEQQKMDTLAKAPQSEPNNLIDEQDDESTRNELNRNVALRQQIQQEINVFGSIFDIMRTFIQRLRESAATMVRDVMRPGASNNNDNNAVTPGPSVKPQVDKLLDEIIDSQRVINGQAKPVLVPNDRPSLTLQG